LAGAGRILCSSVVVYAAVLSGVLVGGACGAARAATLPTEFEKVIGNHVARQVVAQMGEVDDPLLADWVSDLGRQIAAHSPRQDLHYHFKVVNTSEINAFASPGGHIFVTRGLLSYVDSEDELAAILAHEVGHVAHKDFQRMVVDYTGTFLLVTALGYYPETRSLARPASIWRAFAGLRQCRKYEYVADKSGVDLALAAGYDPEGLDSFFARSLKDRKKREPAYKVAFHTHPDDLERRRRVAARAAREKADYETVLRLGNSFLSRYRYNSARKYFQVAAKLEPENPEPLLWSAQVLREQGRLEEARTEYESVLAKYPGQREATEGLASLSAELREARASTSNSMATPEGVALAREALAETAERLEQAQKAQTAHRQAIKRNLRRLNQLQTAHRVLKMGFAIDPKLDLGYYAILVQINQVIFDLQVAKGRVAEGRERYVAAMAGMRQVVEDTRSELDKPQRRSPELVRHCSRAASESSHVIDETAVAGGKLQSASRELLWAAGSLVPIIIDLTGLIENYDHLPASRYGILQAGVTQAGLAVRDARRAAEKATEEGTRADLRRLALALDLQGLKATDAERRIFVHLAGRRTRTEAGEIEGLVETYAGVGQGALAAAVVRSAEAEREKAEQAYGRTGSWADAGSALGANLVAVQAAVRLLNKEVLAERVKRSEPVLPGSETPRVVSEPAAAEGAEARVTGAPVREPG